MKCKNCKIKDAVKYGRYTSGEFCSKECACSFSTKEKRSEINEKVSKTLKNRQRRKKELQKYICEKCGEKFEDNLRKGRRIRCKNCRRRTKSLDINSIKYITELSRRTVSKIINRMLIDNKISCSICEWNEGRGHIHHINGKKIKNPDNHKNLTYVCPNHHTLIHENKIKKEDLINLQTQIGEKWRNYYLG